MLKYLFIIFFIIMSGCSKEYCDTIDNIFNDVSPMVEEANVAFIKAEAKILIITPDNIIRPDPDPAKCPCKGTGLIKHGDGHTTKCPYHEKSTATLKR